MTDEPHYVEENTRKLYKWAGIGIILLLILMAVVVLPFLVSNTTSKILIYLMIGVVIIILIGSIVSTEWLRITSQRRRRRTRDDYDFGGNGADVESIQYRSNQPESTKKKRLTERSSWTFWHPRKSREVKPTAPPYETDV